MAMSLFERMALADNAATAKCGYNAEIVKDLLGNAK
jgi:hypothetical protein